MACVTVQNSLPDSSRNPRAVAQDATSDDGQRDAAR